MALLTNPLLKLNIYFMPISHYEEICRLNRLANTLALRGYWTEEEADAWLKKNKAFLI